MGYEWENNRISQQAMFDDQRVWDFHGNADHLTPKKRDVNGVYGFYPLLRDTLWQTQSSTVRYRTWAFVIAKSSN